ncbi:MAG: Gfo/Idh/MocA family oxidoreductase, partial [Actinobacteria bacterium]
MAKPIRVGVVGFGYWGPNLVRNLDRLGDAELVCACDLSEANLAKLASLYPYAETTTDLAGMLARDDIDAVVVATSAPSHFAIAKQVLSAGKHCFVEKPLTLKSADSETLVRLADERGVVLMVGHLMEYHSAINWIKDYIATGDMGDVLYVYMQRLNLGKVRTEENAFWSLAPHDVSIVLYLLGETPDYVSANGAAYVTEGVQDTVFANLHFPSGKMANIHVSWLDPHKVRKLTVVGTKKMLVFDDMEATEKIWIYDRGVGEPKDAMAYGEDLTLRFGEIK